MQKVPFHSEHPVFVTMVNLMYGTYVLVSQQLQLSSYYLFCEHCKNSCTHLVTHYIVRDTLFIFQLVSMLRKMSMDLPLANPSLSAICVLAPNITDLSI